jgi:hypothetical protein
MVSSVGTTNATRKTNLRTMSPFLYVDLDKVVFSISMSTPEIFTIAFLAVCAIVLALAIRKNHNSDE